MSFAAVRRMGFAAAWAAGVTLLVAVGCSAQGEGERCDNAKNENGDCDEGLVCVSREELQDTSIGDRCCAPEGAPIAESACLRNTGAGPSGGGAGSGATSGGANSGGAASGGRVNSGGSGQGGNDSTASGGTDSATAGADASGAGGV